MSLVVSCNGKSPLPDEVVGDVGVAHQIQSRALVVELGASFAAVKQVEGLGGGMPRRRDNSQVTPAIW